MTKMFVWWATAVVAAWLLLPPALENLWASLGGLAEVVGVPTRELLKLVGGVAVVALVWHWTQPEGRASGPRSYRSSHRRSHRSSYPRR
jgi:hypothetical protein